LDIATNSGFAKASSIVRDVLLMAVGS